MILFYSFFSPPKNGVSFITEKVFDEVRHSSKLAVKAIPLNSKYTGYYSRKVGRVVQMVKVFLSIFLLSRKATVIYLTPSGGVGIILEIFMLLAMKVSLFSGKVFIHHHSYGYCYSKNYLYSVYSYCLSMLTTKHIFLSPRMKKDYQQHYGCVKSIIMSNAAFFDDLHTENLPMVAGSTNIGMLCNIEASKGVRDFIALAEYCERHDSSLKFQLAGPFHETSVGKDVVLASSRLSNFSYTGPLYGQDKISFLRDLSVFYYPTKNDAEPVVIYEAMSVGIPVIATNVGCIQDMLPRVSGSCFVLTEVLPPAVFDNINYLLNNYDEVVFQHSKRLLEIQNGAKLSLRLLIKELVE